jgi:Alpha-glucosidases, family 31 of glycosyl hydrolases
VRPLGLEFPEDEDAFKIHDEYMVGPYLLYAPILDKGVRQRDVYLPRGAWMDLATGRVHLGPSWVVSEADMPLYIRSGSAVPTQEALLIYGEGRWTIYRDEGPASVTRLGNAVETEVQWPALYMLGERLAEVVVNGRRRSAAYAKLGTYVEQGD